ncbi:MAG TPA: RnfABCDGE type electron transport complex subunit G [Eubacteriales bacterium]|nr:RnfABCDGE type electron transport complex subunit G [Clostridia bacterium]HRV72385.1 RnfABCDGE type electron transport complex subunit G [Eubacteriales bacterium]
MRKESILVLGLKLLAIAIIAGLALGVVNAITKEPIAEQTRLAADEARRSVLPLAAEFTQIEGSDIYEGKDSSNNIVGYTLAGITNGYGGEIEVTVGIDLEGIITGVSVGGANFSETAGLGAKTKTDPTFRQQFIGLSGTIALKKDGGQIDAVTSATISSRAVTNEVEALRAELVAYLGGK